MFALVVLAKGQEKKPKTKRPGLRKDLVYACQLIPKPGNPLLTTMLMDTWINGSIKLPNSYRKGGAEPVPTPTHRFKLMMLKRKQDPSNKTSIQPIPMPGRKSYPAKPKE